MTREEISDRNEHLKRIMSGLRGAMTPQSLAASAGVSQDTVYRVIRKDTKRMKTSTIRKMAWATPEEAIP